jgi:hypothetical protein
MKKIILFLSLILSWIYLANFISAITINKNSWEVLDNTTWENISSLTNKIDVSWADIKLNWKLYVTWKICDNSWFCLGDSIEWTITNPWKSCLDLKGKWVDVDKEYYIKPDWYAGSPFKVYCDMTTDWWGWTRYVNIKWNYSFNDAYACWQKSDWTNITGYTNLECFNPNRYNISANNIMLKFDGNTYTRSLTLTPSVNTTTNWASSYYCVWWKEYMTIMTTHTWSMWEDGSFVWLWLNYCAPSWESYQHEMWGMAFTWIYEVRSQSWFWPNVFKPWSGTAAKSEFFIK